MSHLDIVLAHASAAARRHENAVDLVLATKHGTAAYRTAMARMTTCKAVADGLQAVADEILGTGLRLTERIDNTSAYSATTASRARTD